MGADVATLVRTIDRGTRRFALGGLLIVLLLRLLVPTGWMPVATPASGIAITICTGMGAVSAYIDAEGKLHRTDKSGADLAKDVGLCPFASGLSMLPVLDVLVASYALVWRTTLAHLDEAVAIGRGLAAPPPPPTGPPAIR